MINEFSVSLTPTDAKQIHATVVRVVDNVYTTKDGMVYERKLRLLKRLCKGFNIITDEISDSPVECAGNIVNLFSVPEGIYELRYTNISGDFETGRPDGWDYKLIPYGGRK